MSSTFAQAWWGAIRSPDRWDGAGAAFTTIDEYFKGLAALQKQAAHNLLSSVDDCLAYARGYNAYYQTLAKVNAQIARDFPVLTGKQGKTGSGLSSKQIHFTNSNRLPHASLKNQQACNSRIRLTQRARLCRP